MCGVDCQHDDVVDPTPKSGYAYMTHAVFGTRLEDIDNEEWHHEVLTPTGKELYVCTWKIDDVWHNVWWDEAKEEFIAQVAI